MGATADKVAKAIISQERSGVVNLESYRASREAISDARLDENRLGELLAKGHDPAHAIFIYAQNFVSLLSDMPSGLKETRHFSQIIGKAEDEYAPGFPPMSPITTSYFTMWALFDVLFGQSGETVGTCIQRLAKEFSIPGWLMDVVNKMQQSRMGFYVHGGFDERYILLREIYTGEIKRCLSTSNYQGKEGELWLVRLMAPSNDLATYHIAVTTPYVLVQTTEDMISSCLAREIARLGNKKIPHGMDAYTFVMKHGPSPNHRNEYIFCAYSGYRPEAVFITGIPDIKESLPHADPIHLFPKGARKS